MVLPISQDMSPVVEKIHILSLCQIVQAFTEGKYRENLGKKF